MATGMETVDIARRMLVSERTAKRMVAALLHKLGASTRIAAATMAGRYGLLDDLADAEGFSLGFGSPGRGTSRPLE
jgi:two-component system nitrate/nitrite response regulator NarL